MTVETHRDEGELQSNINIGLLSVIFKKDARGMGPERLALPRQEWKQRKLIKTNYTPPSPPTSPQTPEHDLQTKNNHFGKCHELCLHSHEFEGSRSTQN